jgi:hypothetical protein
MLAVAALGFALRRLEDHSCTAGVGGTSCVDETFSCGGGQGKCDASCPSPTNNGNMPDCDGFTDYFWTTTPGGGQGHFVEYKVGRWCGYGSGATDKLNVMQSIHQRDVPMRNELAAYGLW